MYGRHSSSYKGIQPSDGYGPEIRGATAVFSCSSWTEATGICSPISGSRSGRHPVAGKSASQCVTALPLWVLMAQSESLTPGWVTEGLKYDWAMTSRWAEQLRLVAGYHGKSSLPCLIQNVIMTLWQVGHCIRQAHQNSQEVCLELASLQNVFFLL